MHTSFLHRQCATDTFSIALTIDATSLAVQGFQLIFGFDPSVMGPLAVLKGGVLEESDIPSTSGGHRPPRKRLDTCWRHFYPLGVPG